MSASVRHPFELILDRLSGAMRIRHGFGTREDAAHTAPDRIVWIPAALDRAPHRFAGEFGETVGLQAAKFDVSIYGGDPGTVYRLHAELAGWLDTIAGPPNGGPKTETSEASYGYAVGTSKVAPRGGDPASSGWGAVVSVTLFAPIDRSFYAPGVVRFPTVDVLVDDTVVVP